MKEYIPNTKATKEIPQRNINRLDPKRILHIKIKDYNSNRLQTIFIRKRQRIDIFRM